MLLTYVAKVRDARGALQKSVLRNFGHSTYHLLPEIGSKLPYYDQIVAENGLSRVMLIICKISIVSVVIIAFAMTSVIYQ